MAGHFIFIGLLMIINDVRDIVEEWAPKTIAWERDNVGLQVGSGNHRVKGILVCLDVTEANILEAQRRGANLIISHHPLIFTPLRSVDLGGYSGRCIERLLRSRIALYSAHTNLDFTIGGTSFALAERLGLRKIDFLHKGYKLGKKIVTFVPSSHVQQVADAMSNAGAGVIGNYSSCSFRTDGTGTFKGNNRSRPSVGRKNKLEEVPETRLEMIVDGPHLNAAIQALIATHPYEEVAYDVYPLENESASYGMGVIGEFPRAMPQDRFLAHLQRRLGADSIRYSRGRPARVRRVAVCGGSGSDLTEEAIRQHADAFVTADIRYHAFHDALGRILLIDAGHYETERPVIEAAVSRLRDAIAHRRPRVPVFATRISSNPIAYH